MDPLYLNVRVLVPMELSVYANYGASADHRVHPSVAAKDTAYLAPIPQVHNAGSNSLKHDVFEHLDPQPPGVQADPERILPSREGIYLHWSLPRHYRTAFTASSSTTDTSLKRARAGYPPPSPAADGYSSTDPLFRPLPDKYVIMRRMTGAMFHQKEGWMQADRVAEPPIPARKSSMFMITASDSSPEIPMQINGGKGPPLISFFVVDAAVIRKANEIAPEEDVQITATPFHALDDDIQDFMGQAFKLGDYVQTTTSSKNRLDTLTIMSTGNPYFADYQPHSPSVLSLFDPVTIEVDEGRFRPTQTILDYAVAGWHTNPMLDPLYGKEVPDQTIASRLEACGLALDRSELTVAYNSLLDKPGHGAMSVCHGWFRGVRWGSYPSPQDVPQPRPAGVPDKTLYSALIIDGQNVANQVQASFANAHPLSVGTNSIDALFGWLRMDSAGLKVSDTKKSLMKIQSFVLDVNDNLDSQLQAEDLLATNNFAPIAGCPKWSFEAHTDKGSKDKSPMQPSPDEHVALSKLNDIEKRIDQAKRLLQVCHQRLFYLWWIYASNEKNMDTSTSVYAQWRQQLAQVVASVKNTIQQCQGVISTFSSADITDVRPRTWTVPIQQGADDGFFTQRDPTILVAGAGYASPFSKVKPCPVRVDGQNSLRQSDGSLPEHRDRLLARIPDWYPLQKLHKTLNHDKVGDLLTCEEKQPYFSTTLLRIFNEALCVEPSLTMAASPYWDTARPAVVPPKLTPTGTKHQMPPFWKNGWHPLFIEWEVEYYNVPWENWEFKPCGPESRVGYAIKESVDVSKVVDATECRVLRGRVPFTTQAAASLKVVLSNVFARIPPEELDSIMPLSERTKLLSEADKVNYLSTPMAGIMDQLSLRMKGNHFVPVGFDHQGRQMVDSTSESQASAIGINKADLVNIAATNGMQSTPLTRNADGPFHPVTHGQFRFSKFTIFDRWGQTVQGIRPLSPSGDSPRNALFPCLGEAYSVQAKAGGKANTAVARDDTLCEFVQIPPVINQDAKVSARFLNSRGDRFLDEAESPIKCFVVFDSFGKSLKVFDPTGHFIQEHDVASGAITHGPYADDTTAASALLDDEAKSVLKQFKDSAWLTPFFTNLQRAVASAESRPHHYAQSLLGLFGRPLALVKFGVGLQLADAPRADPRVMYAGGWHDVATSPVGSNNSPAFPKPLGTPVGNKMATAPRTVQDYAFSLKIGDRDNVFDGLHGFWTRDAAGSAWDTSKFFCYHATDDSLVPPFISVRPSWNDPCDDSFSNRTIADHTPLLALIDPFTSFHIHSALLPIKTVTVPPEPLSAALAHVGAFFRAGNFVTTIDPPAFSRDAIVHLNDPTKLPASQGKIKLPLGTGLRDWAWLQPYYTYAEEVTPQTEAAHKKKTLYNPLDVEAVGGRPVWDGKSENKAPNAVVGGYLQARRGFRSADFSG